MATEIEMLKYATKFELPVTEGLKLSIEKIESSGNRWLLTDRDIQVFDVIEHKFVSINGDFSKCAPYRCHLLLKTAFFSVEKLIQWKEEEILQCATKFEFPTTKDMRITLEKGTQGFSHSWSIRNKDTQIFDYHEYKFIFPYFKRYSPDSCYATLDTAFQFVRFILQDYEKFKVDYNGRCHDCGERVGEHNLKVSFGNKVCQDCYNKID
jgi:hypothetical protein